LSFVLKVKKKKDGEKKSTTSFEDSMKAKAKLNLLEERYNLVKSLVATDQQNVNELNVSKILKLLTIGTQGLGEVGDKARPSNDAVEGFQELMEMAMLDELEYGNGNDIDKVNNTLLFGALTNLINRSIRREHTNVEIVTIPPEMFMPGWLLRSSRESSLVT